MTQNTPKGQQDERSRFPLGMVRYTLDVAPCAPGACGARAMSEQIKPLDAKTIGASTYRGRKAQTLLQAARHNLRDIQKELGANSHIDATRIGLNETVAGPDTPAAVAALALSLMEVAGVDVSKLRKDHTQAHELLFTLSAETTVNPRDYFGCCLAWAGDQFGPDNIVSGVIHLDEAAPHLHVLLAPIEAGRYVGTSLIDRARLKKLRALFATEVAPTFGLKVMQPLTGARRSQVIQLIRDRLESTQDAILQSALWQTVKADIERNPSRYMANLGITHVPINDGGAEFRRIALSAGKGGKKERKEKPYGFETGVSDDVSKPYGFKNDPEKHRNPSCVGFTPRPALRTASNLPQTTPRAAPAGNTVQAPCKPDATTEAPFIETTRVERDSDCSSDRYDSDTGEFFAAPKALARLQKQAADRWVASALAATAR